MKNRAVIYCVLAGLMWGSSGVFSNLLSPYGFSPLQLTSTRGIVSGIAVAIYVLIYNKKLFRITGRQFALFACGGVALSIWGHLKITDFKAQFLQIDFTAYEKYAKRRRKEYITSTFWFDAHYFVFALVLLVCAALVFNYFWKLHLMKMEKQLIDAGKGGTL